MSRSNRRPGEATNFEVASLIATYVTESLHEVGYSEAALNWIYSLLVDALLVEGEDVTLAELLQEIDLIHRHDGEEAEDEATEIEYLN